jgi:hypothetical protein
MTENKPDPTQQHNAEHQYVRQKVAEFDNELTFLAGKIDRTERDYLMFKEQIFAVLTQITQELRAESEEMDEVKADE